MICIIGAGGCAAALLLSPLPWPAKVLGLVPMVLALLMGVADSWLQAKARVDAQRVADNRDTAVTMALFERIRSMEPADWESALTAADVDVNVATMVRARLQAVAPRHVPMQRLSEDEWDRLQREISDERRDEWYR